MIHFGFPKPTTNIQKPYFDDVWTKKKLKHKFDKMFFSILYYEFNDEFYIKKMRLNPFNKALTALKRWIKNVVPEGIIVESILLDTHYMYDKVNDMAKNLVVIDKTNSTSFL
jgi:spore coat polysaccharide biosynthesis predicted glycosyltransferase SpsG